jgi:hypothetical protein
LPGRLNPEIERRIEVLFSPGSRSEIAELLLHECGNNLPFLEKLNEIELERFRFAALKLSAGNIDKFKEAIALAKADWRDLLVSAGFAMDFTAHNGDTRKSDELTECPP